MPPGLLPLSAHGWPGSPLPPQAYPLDVMETGTDILFFWVARMSMLCSYLQPTTTTAAAAAAIAASASASASPPSPPPPFRRACFHPLVRDRHGHKMSKSKGNVVDPLHLIRGATLEEIVASVQGGPCHASTPLACPLP